jgi:hypothetical protein
MIIQVIHIGIDVIRLALQKVFDRITKRGFSKPVI